MAQMQLIVTDTALLGKVFVGTSSQQDGRDGQKALGFFLYGLVCQSLDMFSNL